MDTDGAEPRLGYEGNQPRRHRGTEGKNGILNHEIRERRELLDRITGRTGAGEFLTTDDTDQHGWVGQRATESRENPFFRAEAQRAQRGGGNHAKYANVLTTDFTDGHGWGRASAWL